MQKWKVGYATTTNPDVFGLSLNRNDKSIPEFSKVYIMLLPRDCAGNISKFFPVFVSYAIVEVTVFNNYFVCGTDI